MASEIRVPRLGWNMERGVFVGWLKRDGETVRAGEALFTLEGDKSTQDVEALDGGILRVAPNCPKDGDEVEVGALLGYVETSSPASPGDAPASPPPSRQAVTPRARRAARERAVDLTQVRGTGRNGRVRERDVLAHAGPARESAATPPVSPLRRTIAERMIHSLRTTAPVTLTTTADATNLVNLREQLRAAPPTKDAVVPGYTDLIVKLAAVALQSHPLLNARWDDGEISTSTGVHVGIAVDTDAGLLVPVVRDVQSLTLRRLAARTRELAEMARTRRLAPDDMKGGTFTVTNLGGYGVDAFTPIINWPECSILGVGRIRKLPAVVNNQVVPRDVVTLSLTFDHRLVDGGPAARFLQTLCGGIENPAAWLVE
jgi:pyruvate dehydrogenase E2 component (dihydrolipoamide acetyltransferase)